MVDVDGRPVLLTGFADRLEIDDAGRVVVVDFKSARTPPTGPAVAGNLQLALYQYAVDAGALDEAAGRPSRSGGAELVQLGIDDDSAVAKVQGQPAHDDAGPSVPSCAPGWPAPPSWCAPRPSRRPRDRTAATARSSPSARPRAPGA